MEVVCPSCGAKVHLTAGDIASRSRLNSMLCPACGKTFDARQAVAETQPKRADVVTGRTAGAEMLTKEEASALLSKELREPHPDVKKSVDALLRKAPEKIGEYKIVKELSRGGMGIVYKALDPRLKRDVAIKVLLAGAGATAEDIQRFEREAQATARLRHPNIVPIYAVGLHEGRPYYVMDFVEGRTAKQLKDQGKMTPRLALSIIQGVADALHHAHQHGVVHRDVKPANIIVSSAEHPQLTDFGLARRVDEDVEITKSGSTMGTPSYMAPEQAEGHLEEVDAQSDVYSAGACLYELLTGAAPFDGMSTMAILRKVIDETPVPPRKRNPKIHRDVETICLKCLEKSKRNRYANAGQLAEDIRRFNAGEAILAKPAGPVVRFFRKARRHKEITLAALAMVLSGVGVLAFTLNQANSAARREIQEREEKLKTALGAGNENVARAQGLSAALAAGGRDFEPTLTKARALLDEAGNSFSQAEAVAPERANVKAALDRVRKLSNELEVRRFIFKARAFLYPPQDHPEDPNYAGAEFAAQEALYRDPGNAEARELLRVAVGKRKVSIQVTILPNNGGAGVATVFSKRVMDAQGRQLPVESELGEKLGDTPLKALELESGLYVLTFQRGTLPPQQATLAVTRDARDEDLAFKIALNCLDENMVRLPEGEVSIPEGDTVRVKAFAIDRFEFPNKAGVVPLSGVTLVEAKSQCAGQGKRLCTSAQWLRACRGDEQRRYPYGPHYVAGACAAGLDAAVQKHPVPSGFYARCRTPEGIYDMSGNVAEWTDTDREDALFGGDYTSTLKFADLESSCRARAMKEQIAETRRGFRCCKEGK